VTGTRTTRPTLYLVRHGETDWNAQGRLQGRRDVPLNGLGRAQAEQAGRRLGEIHPDPASLDYLASPLGRTRATMEGLRATLGLAPAEYRQDPRLKEIAFGDWEGSTWKEIRRRDPARARARDADRWGYVPPGEGAESYALLAERVLPVVTELERPTVVVSHGGVTRALLVGLGLLEKDAAPRFDVWQGRVLLVDAAGWRWA
jgi:broad specificity phosphatase PhoE